MIVKKKRARCEEDSEAEEEAVYYVLAAYTDHLSRSRSALAVSQNYIEAVIRAYVASRASRRPQRDSSV